MRRINNSRQKSVVFLLAVVGLVLAAFIFIYLPSRNLVSRISSIKSLIKPMKDSLLLQELPKVEENLSLFDKELALLEADYGRLFYLRFIPFLGTYFSDGDHLIKGSHDLIVSARVFVETVIPFAPKLGFKGGNPEEPIVGGQERLAGVVKLAPSLVENYDQITAGIRLANAEIEKIDPRRYPSKFRGTEIRGSLELLKGVLSSLDQSSEDIRNLLSELPGIMGEPDKVSYLVLFQNDKEIRPTGGFLTAYAIFTLEKSPSNPNRGTHQ